MRERKNVQIASINMRSGTTWMLTSATARPCSARKSGVTVISRFLMRSTVCCNAVTAGYKTAHTLPVFSAVSAASEPAIYNRRHSLSTVIAARRRRAVPAANLLSCLNRSSVAPTPSRLKRSATARSGDTFVFSTAAGAVFFFLSAES